jgi:hypothetical protein
MRLYAKNVRMLRTYKRFRGKRPTVLKSLWAIRRGLVPNVVLAVVLCLLASALADFPRSVVIFGIGMCAGAFFRDIGYAMAHTGQWAVFEQIVDWDRVDEILEEHEKTAKM